MRAKFSALDQTHSVHLRANLVSIGLFCRPLAASNPKHWISTFSNVDSWWHSDEVEHGCTSRNLPQSKIVSVPQRLRGEIGRTNSDVQKRDGQTDKKFNVFGRPGGG